MIFTLYMKYIFTKQPYKLRHAQNYFYSVTKIVQILFFFHLYVKGSATCNSQDADSHIASYQLANVIPLISAEVRESVKSFIFHIHACCVL